MNRLPATTRVAAALALAALSVAGVSCSAGDEPSVSRRPTPPSDAKRPAGGERPLPATTAASVNCKDAAVVFVTVFSGASWLVAAAAVPGRLTELRSEIEELESSVPTALRADYAALARAYVDAAGELAAIRGEDPRAPALPDARERAERAVAPLESPPIVSVRERLLAHFETCISGLAPG